MQFPYDLLKTFVAVADTGNFTKAGQHVSRTQSAISMQIKRLESEAGHSLFERKGGMKGIRLTSKGEKLLGYARRLLALHDEAVASVISPGVEGKIRLGLPEDFSTTYMPGILARFSRTHPNAQVEVLCAPGMQISKELEEGTLDIGIRSGVESIEGAELLIQESITWIVSPSSLIYERNPVPLAVYWEGCSYRKWALRSLQDSNRNYHIAFTSLSIAGIYAAVRAGLAVAAVGRSNLTTDVKVLGKAEGYPDLPKAMVTLHHKKGTPSTPARCLAQHIHDEFKAISEQTAPLVAN